MINKSQLLITECTASSVAESFRILRTNIQNFEAQNPLNTIMFTSAGPKEGKSTVIANLAVAFTWLDKKVLIVDCDLRNPVQAQIFGKDNRGITNYLVEKCDWRGLIQNTGINNLDLLGSGPIPSNPGELLTSPMLGELLTKLKGEYDYLLIDVAPVSVVADACFMAPLMDGIYLVVAANTVRPEMANQVQKLLRNANGRICGVILNRADNTNSYPLV